MIRVLHYCDHFKEYTSNLVLALNLESAGIQSCVENTVVVRSGELEGGIHEGGGRRDDEVELHSDLIGSCAEVIVLPRRYRSPKALALLRRRVLRPDSPACFDVFHLQSSFDPRFLWLAWRMPTVLTVHEPSPRTGLPIGRGWRDMVRRWYRRLAGVIIVHTESGLRGLSPAELEKSVVIPHGVHIRNVDSSPTSKKILFFGRVARYKGLDVLLDAMEIVWETVPDAELRILASPGDDDNGRDTADYDPRIRATWCGYSRTELERALSDARAVCMPYLSASGSGVGAEAMGAGKLVVASDLEDLREVAAHPDLLVKPGCAQDLARALVAVLSNDYEPRPVDPGRTWPAVSRKHLSVYQSLIGLGNPACVDEPATSSAGAGYHSEEGVIPDTLGTEEITCPEPPNSPNCIT